MSAALLEALAPPPPRDGFDPAAWTERSLARIRRRRLRRWAGAAVAAGAMVALALVPGAPFAAAPSALEDAGPAADSSPLDAEQLTSDATFRARGQDGTGQEGLLCGARGQDPGARDGVRPCAAVWIGDAPLVSLSATLTHATAQAWETEARLTVRWVLVNESPRPLTVDRSGGMVAVTTDPAAVSLSSPVRDRADSLWLSNVARAGRISDATDRVTLEPGALLAGEAVMTASAPSTGDTGDPVWRIATGDADGTLTVQARIASTAPRSAQAVLVEASLPLAPVSMVTAEALASTFSERAEGAAASESLGADRAWSTAQRALLCDLPAMLQRTSSGGVGPFSAGEVACTPGWVEGPVVVPTGSLMFDGAGVAARATWELRNVTDQLLEYSRIALMLEAPGRLDGAPDASMSLLGSVIAAPAGAWRSDGTRLTWLDNAQAGGTLEPGGTLARVDRLYPAMRWVEHPVDVTGLLSRLSPDSGATGLVVLPFVTDQSRVLVLEVPLRIAQPFSPLP